MGGQGQADAPAPLRRQGTHPEGVIWLLARAENTLGLLGKIGKGWGWILCPGSAFLSLPVLPQLSATFTIPIWQWFLTRFGKKMAVYVGISVSEVEGQDPR